MVGLVTAGAWPFLWSLTEFCKLCHKKIDLARVLFSKIFYTIIYKKNDSCNDM